MHHCNFYSSPVYWNTLKNYDLDYSFLELVIYKLVALSWNDTLNIISLSEQLIPTVIHAYLQKHVLPAAMTFRAGDSQLSISDNLYKHVLTNHINGRNSSNESLLIFSNVSSKGSVLAISTFCVSSIKWKSVISAQQI